MTTSTPTKPITTEAIEADLIERARAEIADELGEDAQCVGDDGRPAVMRVRHEACGNAVLACGRHVEVARSLLSDPLVNIFCEFCGAQGLSSRDVTFRPI